MRKVIYILHILFIGSILISGKFFSNPNLLFADIRAEQELLDSVEEELQYLNYLTEQKDLIEQYQKAGHRGLILESFNRVVNELEAAYSEYDVLFIERKHQEIRIVYRDIEYVEDLYRFYDALYDYYQQNFAEAKDKLIYFVDNYQQSSKIRQAFGFLDTLYFREGLNREIVNLHIRFPQFSSPQSSYRLAHAYFNLREYDNSRRVFENLSTNADFGFRSRVMLGIIAYATFDTEQATGILQSLADQYDQSQEYYGFLILTLARIYGEQGNFVQSLQYYEQYVNIIDNQLTDELLYEISLIYYALGDYDRALSYLEQIIEYAEQSPIYEKALTQIAGIKVFTEGFEVSQDIISDVLFTNRTYHTFLEYETKLIERMRDRVEEIVYEDNLEVIDQLFNNIFQYEEITQRKTNLEVFGIDWYTLNVNKMINEEYVGLLEVIAETYELAKIVRTRPNDPIVRQIQYQIYDLDTLKVDLLTEVYVNNVMDEFVPQSVRGRGNTAYARHLYMSERKKWLDARAAEARSIATRIVYYQNFLEDNKERLSEHDKSLVAETLDLYKEEADLMFGYIDQEDPYVNDIMQEMATVTETRTSLISMKAQAAESYHERMADRIERMNIESFQESEPTHTTILKSIKETRSDIEQINQGYEYALLDILFQENIRRNQEYRYLMEQDERAFSEGEDE